MDIVHQQIAQAAHFLQNIAHNAKFQEQKQAVHTQYIERH